MSKSRPLSRTTICTGSPGYDLHIQTNQPTLKASFVREHAAFFHTKEAGPDAPCYRFHIVSPDTLEMQHIEPRKEGRNGNAANHGFRLQRVFNNRHIENLFRDFASIKFFLARDNVREVLVVR